MQKTTTHSSIRPSLQKKFPFKEVPKRVFFIRGSSTAFSNDKSIEAMFGAGYGSNRSIHVYMALPSDTETWHARFNATLYAAVARALQHSCFFTGDDYALLDGKEMPSLSIISSPVSEDIRGKRHYRPTYERVIIEGKSFPTFPEYEFQESTFPYFLEGREWTRTYMALSKEKFKDIVDGAIKNAESAGWDIRKDINSLVVLRNAITNDDDFAYSFFIETLGKKASSFLSYQVQVPTNTGLETEMFVMDPIAYYFKICIADALLTEAYREIAKSITLFNSSNQGVKL